MARLPGISANLNAFLDTIGDMEGTTLIPNSDDGYRVICGSTPKNPFLFSDYSDHPNKPVWIPRLHEFSTAAGRYQIIARYFDAYKKQLDLPDFGPESQDRIAIQMLKEVNALPNIEAGNIRNAIMKAASHWQSFPGATSQGSNTLDDVVKIYQDKRRVSA